MAVVSYSVVTVNLPVVVQRGNAASNHLCFSKVRVPITHRPPDEDSPSAQEHNYMLNSLAFTLHFPKFTLIMTKWQIRSYYIADFAHLSKLQVDSG